MTKNLLKTFLELQTQKKDLEQQIKIVSENLLKQMNAEKIDKIESEIGKVSIAKRTTWIFSDIVKTKEEEVKKLKVEEQEKGIATPKETQYLRTTI